MSKNEILSIDQIILDEPFESQKAVFNKIAEIAEKLGFIKKQKTGFLKKNSLVKSFIEREHESTTGFGESFAIPHARNHDILKTGVFIIRSSQPIEWKALDDAPVTVAIALVVPEGDAANQHLELLSKIAVKLQKEKVKKILLTSTNKEQIIKEILADE